MLLIAAFVSDVEEFSHRYEALGSGVITREGERETCSLQPFS